MIIFCSVLCFFVKKGFNEIPYKRHCVISNFLCTNVVHSAKFLQHEIVGIQKDQTTEMSVLLNLLVAHVFGL